MREMLEMWEKIGVWGSSASLVLGVAIVSFVVALAATPIARAAALRRGWLDLPDGERKWHSAPVPYLGGAALLAAWCAGMVVAWAVSRDRHGVAWERAGGLPWELFAGALVVTFIGLWDDLRRVGAKWKVLGEITAGLLVAHWLADRQSGWELLTQGDAQAWLRVAAAVVFVVGACNAMNFIDGLDGLAAGVAAIAAGGLLGISCVASRLIAQTYEGGPSPGYWMVPMSWQALSCAALIGAAAGFYVFNRAPARIFMGDAGSLLLGFLLAAAILGFAVTPQARGVPQGFVGEVTGRWFLSALIVFALPITDVAQAVVRRARTGRSIFAGDRGHIHHALLNAGLDERRAVRAMHAIALSLAFLGVLAAWLAPWWW